MIHRPPLPADLEILPTIVCDTREQTPLAFTCLPSFTGTLTSGDYSIVGLEDDFAIERKSIGDFVACCMGSNRERFERELCRLRGHQFARLLIVGRESEIAAGNYRSNIKPASVLATLAAFEARYVPVVFEDTPERAAARVESWACWYAREIVQTSASIAKASEQLAVK